ncbi:hypothetical protein NECAME_16074 [Necator americanus]|uniref:Uncharacterized protein n=1 Tax=Necator americanus TaxID=51031 RepID=W2U0K3_NECAM|nr:hypothetical protein NECAME_16074 [Necator americanus]ETN86881.1 hypothetical protein NECAME_16074 [Necator americanus]
MEYVSLVRLVHFCTLCTFNGLLRQVCSYIDNASIFTLHISNEYLHNMFSEFSLIWRHT